jgi:hypothetical protein
LAARGEVTHPRTGTAAVPRIPGSHWLDEREAEQGREALAAWLTAPANPYFAHAMVGRIWRDLMGRGLVEPTDDLRATNPPTHPELFDRLASDFVEHDYSLRHAIRLICTSAAYARSSVGTPENAVDDRFYAHAVERPLDAEVLADAIGDVTGVYDEYADHSAGTRAITLVDTSVGAETLDVLGRCERTASCDSAPAGVRGIAARLHLVNGPLLNERLVADEGRLRQLILAGQPDDEIIREFYLRAFGRPPAQHELAYWLEQADGAADDVSRRERLEDFVWSLLNSREFMTNH